MKRNECPRQHRSARRRLVAPARQDRRQPAAALPGRHLAAVFRAPAPGRPGALVRQRHVRLVLVGDQIPRHHAGRHQPEDLFLRRHDGRHRVARHADGLPPAQLHLDGPAEARRAAQGGVAGRRARQPAAAVRHDPRADAARARRIAARRDVRLGRSRVDRADHPDARHAVRLPVRGAAQAHLLVERRDGEHARRHRDRFRRKARRGAAAGDGVLRRALARAREAAAAARPDLDAGARRGDARSAVAAAGVHGQHSAAAGRRQRHHAELDVGRSVGAAQQSRAVSQAASTIPRWSPAWCRRSSATTRR